MTLRPRSDEMRILTVRQPWAWAIIHGGKDVENRVRNIAGDYRGPVAIHAAASTLATFDPSHHYLWPVKAHHKLGVIIGVVDLVGVHEGHNTEQERFKAVRSCYQPGKAFGPCSEWAQPDTWHLELSNPRPLRKLIEFKGALGLRRLDADTIRQIEEQLA